MPKSVNHLSCHLYLHWKISLRQNKNKKTEKNENEAVGGNVFVVTSPAAPTRSESTKLLSDEGGRFQHNWSPWHTTNPSPTPSCKRTDPPPLLLLPGSVHHNPFYMDYRSHVINGKTITHISADIFRRTFYVSANE